MWAKDKSVSHFEDGIETKVHLFTNVAVMMKTHWPFHFFNSPMRWLHSSMILSSQALFPIPKSRRFVKEKRLISFHESPLDHKTPEIEPLTFTRSFHDFSIYLNDVSDLLLTVFMIDILHNHDWISFTKLIGVVDQRLLHRLVSGQNHHFIGSQIDGEDWPILPGKLWPMTDLETRLISKEQQEQRGSPHLHQSVVGSLQIQLQQVSNDGKRCWSGGTSSVLARAESHRGGEVEEQQENQSSQQGDPAGRL